MKSIEKNDRFVFISTAIMMIIVHGFSFANLMFTHDSLYFYLTVGPQKVQLGRWLYPLVVLVRNFATPWVIGFFSVIYVSLAAVLVVRLFELDRVKGLCVSLLFSANIALVPLFSTFIFDADADCLALLLACFAVYSFEKFPEKKRMRWAGAAIVLCLALYQAYIGVTIGLFLMLLICKASKCKNDQEVKTVFKLAFKMLGLLAVSAVIYVAVMILAAVTSGAGLDSGYNGAGQLRNLSAVGLILTIPKSYIYMLKSFIKPTSYNGILVILSNVILIFASFFYLIKFIKEKRGFRGSLKIIIPALILLPLGVNAIFLVSFGTMHQLMIYSFCLIYLLPLVLFDTFSVEKEAFSGKVYKACIAAIAVIGLSNMIYANGSYVYRKLIYDNTLLHAHTIWQDINSVDGYVEGKTPVLFAGEFYNSKVKYIGPISSRYADTMIGATDTGITYYESIENFYYAVIGRDLNIVMDPDAPRNGADYGDMPCYPTKGYCQMVGDTVIVKMSE